MNKKHYVIFFENGKAVTMTSKEWADNNKNCFKNSFIGNDIPTSNEIDRFLVNERGFTLVADNEKFVCYKLVNN
jgi:hypothetical protein